MESDIVASLQGRLVNLPGGKDKEGRPIVTVYIPADSNNIDISPTLRYILGIFSEESRKRGFTVIVDARKGPWRVARSSIRQVNLSLDREELAQFLVLRPDAFWDKQRVENCTSTQKDGQVIFIPRSRLFKFVEQSQLPFELGGNFIFNGDQWFENRMKVEDFFKESTSCFSDLEELQRRITNIYTLSASQIQNNHQTLMDRLEIMKIIANNTIEKGRELVQKIEYDNRNRKFASESDSMSTPQDTLDTIDKLETSVGTLRRKLIALENSRKSIKKGYVDTKDLSLLEEGVVRVTNWILGPAENLLKSRQKVGYDVASAEDLRREHESIELQCWNAYGTYAELIHKIESFAGAEFLTLQQKDLISQKDFMDFVCRSFATRLERRRNILITSLRFFRLVSEYFDRTGEVFDSLVMGNKIGDFAVAGQKLKELQENQFNLDGVERELVKEGEKLSDMLSMPIKDALGREITVDYSEDIVNIRDILDATTARKNIFSDSVELQKLTLEQVTHIYQYEIDASQAIQWLDELFHVLLKDHGHVGCAVYEIQAQKDEHQVFQETAKCTYNYGFQLLNAAAALRHSCKLPLTDNDGLLAKLQTSWERLLNVSQEQMTRLRVSAVFHRSVEEQCNQLRDLRETVATIPLMDINKKRSRVRHYLTLRERLLVEVGRMVRLGRLLRSRLKESLYYDDAMSEATVKTDSDNVEILEILDSSENATAVEAINERLSEVTELAEELDQALRSAQQDCAISPAATTLPMPITSSKKFIDGTAGTGDEDFQSTKFLRVEDGRSDDEFLTASDCTLQHSRSSSYNTASECEQYSPWWDHGKEDMRENLAKEKLVLAVGLPELPLANSVLRPSPECPPGKIAREVTETTHIKVQHSHTLGVKSFVLTSETVRDKKSDPQEFVIPIQLEQPTEDEFAKRMKECGDWAQLKILEVTPELTTLGNTLSEALELQKAHDEVLRQLQNKQSPVEELLRQADQLISTQKPRAEVYAAMAESLGRAWNDVNAHLELRKQILDLNVQYHTKAQEFFDKMDALEAACSDTVVPIEIEAVRNFLTNIHELRRSVLENLMGALQTGNTLIGKLKELGAEGTLDSRPDRIRSSVSRAITQVQEWMDQLHFRRQILESTFSRRKGQLEKCLALAMLAADLRELEEALIHRREMLNGSDQLGDSSSSAELLQHEHKKMQPEAKQLQERALKITKATEQLIQSGCFAGEQAIGQAYAVLSSASDYLTDLQHRDALFERVIAFFRSAQTALTKLDQLEVQLKTTELPSTSPQLAQLHAQCAATIEEVTSDPITEGYAILESAARNLDASGVKRMIEELENRKIYLGGLCVAHKEENRRINQALNTFLERQTELYQWLVGIAEAFLQGHQDMGSDLHMAKDFLDLHNHLLTDLQTKGNEINTLLLTLPPILEYLEDHQRAEVDSKVEALHERWIKLKNILEMRLDLAVLYLKFHTEADRVNREMDCMEQAIQNGGSNISEESVKQLEERIEGIIPLYQSAKNTGLTFVNEARKVTEPYLDTNRACVCVESVLERLAGRQLTVNRNWQTFHTEVVEKREVEVLIETNIMESTKTINWVSKLDTQLYPVITTTATNPRDITTHIEQKLQTVLPEIKRAQLEVEMRIKTADAIMAKMQAPDDKTIGIRNKLNEMNQRLITITTDYQILLQMMISYFNNLMELDKTIDNFNKDCSKVLPKHPSEVEYIMREHDASKQTILKMFMFAQKECEELVNRIKRQEPKEVLGQDIDKLQYIIQIRSDEFEREWKLRKEHYEAHRQLCHFDNDLQQINETLDDLSRQLAGVKGQYGESLASAKATSLAFVYFEKTIELLEQRIDAFVKTGKELLDAKHIHSPHIARQIHDLQVRWEALKKQIAETRRLIDLSIKFFELVEEADEWFREGSRLLVTIARKSTSVKKPEEAQELLNEIEMFLKPGEIKQNERIKKIAQVGSQLFGDIGPEKVNSVLIENREMMESFNVISRDLNTLSQNLKHAEEQRLKMILDQERLAEEQRLRLKQEQERLEEQRLRMIQEQERLAEEQRLRMLREQERLAEEQRLRMIQEQETLRKIEEQRLRMIQEQERLAEEEKLRMKREQERLAEEQRIRMVQEQETLLKIEEQRLRMIQEQERLAEEEKLRMKREQERLAEEQRIRMVQEQETLRKIEEQRLRMIQEQERLAEEERLRFKREQERIAEEQRVRIIHEQETLHKIEVQHITREIPIVIERRSPFQITEVVEELPILEAPIFTSPLSDQIIQEGSKFTFICQVTGDPLPVVTWHKDGISIQNNPDYQTTFDQGLCTLTIEETFAEDSAKYTCKAINAVGSAETGAFLSVKENEPEEQLLPPTFVKLLQPAVAKEGEEFKFECKVEGNPLPTVAWYKNADCIDNSPDYIITYNNGEAILKFEHVFLEDKADYTCKASNQMGLAQSTANLNVMVEPTEAPTFITPLSNVMARAGQKIKLECEISGLPPPNLAWSQNGKSVKETRELKLHRDGQKATLIIHEAFPKDAGTYTVTASNLAGETTSTCSVSVKGRLPAETSDSELASDMEPIKPSIQVPLKDISINEGNRVRLDCVIVGQPEPEVIWYHDDRPVKESSDFQLLFQGDRCSLIIQEALLEDAGEYKVVALNSAGEASSKAGLTVTPVKSAEKDAKPEGGKFDLVGSAPKFSKLLSDILVSEGDKVILEAAVSGDPRPEVKWLLNNNPLQINGHINITHDAEGNLKLEINNVKPEDRGVYTVKASNPSGDAKCFAQLIVKTLRTAETTKVHEELKSPPVFKESFSDKFIIENTPTKFECIANGKPTPKVRWLFNDNPVSGSNFLISTSGDRQVLTIPNVTKENSGKITCIAENEAGKATCTATLSVQEAAGTDISLLPRTEWSRDLQQHTESNFTYKREVNVQSSTSSSSKVITSSTAAPEPHIEEHKFSSKDHKSFKQINLQAPEVSESHKEEEYHKVGKQPPVIHEKSTSIFTIGGKESEVPKIMPSQEIVIQKSIFKSRPPKFMTPVIGKIVDQDVDVILEGILDGQPTPEVAWTKNGVELKPSENAKITYQHNCARVELKKVSISDAGRYTCTASNEAGKAISTADLVVRKTIFPPVFGRRLQAQVIKKGDRVNMEVEVTGTPDPEVTWFKDNAPLKGVEGYRIKTQGNCHTLILEKADNKHTGKYMVRAVNPGGEAQSIADVAVFEPTPDTMVEVVKTVVFEDVRKHETLASAADKSLETISSGPVAATKLDKLPITIPESYKAFDAHESCKTEISSHSESTIRHDTKTLTLERITPVPEIEMPKKFEATLPTDTIDEGIQTSSISKQQSLDYFVKKMKEVDEPKPKEIVKPAHIKQELYTKFEEVQEKVEMPKFEPIKFEPPKVEPPKFEVPKYEAPKFEPPKFEPVKFEPKKFEPVLPKLEPFPTQVFTTSSQQYSSFSSSSAQSQMYQEFNLTPEPPAEICYVSKPETPIREDVTTKVKRLEEAHRDLSAAEIPSGGVKIFPSPASKSVVSQFSSKVESKSHQVWSSKPEVESVKTEYYKAETIGPVVRAVSPLPSAEGIQMEKLWAPKLLEMESTSTHFEKQSSTRPLSALSSGLEPSAEGIAMEKAWAHKHVESNVQKSWPPPQQDVVKVTPTWSTQSTLEKTWTPETKEIKITPTVSETTVKKETTIIKPVVSETIFKKSETIVSEVLPPPLPVPHYVAQVTHTTNINEISQVYSEQKESKTEYLHEERGVKASEIIKAWPPKQVEEPIFKPVTLESLPIRPVSVQDITDEIYLEPGTPPEIGYAQPPPPTQRRVSLVESIEQDMEKNLEKIPTKVLPGAVRTMPPPLPPKKEQAPPPPVPVKPPKKIVEIPFERFPELEPFPFAAGPEQPKPTKVAPPPTPSKFIKGRFTDSDYESDFEAIRIPAKWKPYASDTEGPAFRHVNPPRPTTIVRSRSIDKDVLPPSRFDQPPQIIGPPRPAINFEACKQIRKETQFKKQTFTKSHEVKKMSPPPLKPGTPPEYVEAKKPQSPKTKHRVVIDGYMADTDEPFVQRKTMQTRHEEKQVFQSQSFTQTQKPISTPKFVHHKKHVSTSASAKKKLVSTPIITSVSSEKKEIKSEVLQPFPFKPEPQTPKVKLPPPPSPSKFVKGEFKESDYESDYDGRIPPVWRSDQERYYKPVRPLLTPTGRQSQTRERTPTPPTEFDNPDRVSMPTRPKFEPIEKAKTVKLEQIIKPVPKPTPIFRPKPIVQQAPITDVIIATPAIPERVFVLQPGSPPEIAYTPGPKKTQYYRSTTSAPYHNAVQTETSNVVHFDESTAHSHRTVSMQQTTKVIKFGDQSKTQVLQPFPFKPDPEGPRRGSAPPPPKPKKFVPGEFRESDYESEVERTVIKPKWIPPHSDTEEPQYRKVQPPTLRSSSVPSRDRDRVLTPMEFDTQPPYQPQFQSNALTKSSQIKSNVIKSTATKIASHHMDSMTNTFKSKAQQFVTDIMDDVNKKSVQKPILKAKDDDAQVYREETRAAQYGTKHVDPDTGLIYFKYDFGYEFGVILPGESKNGEIPVPKKTVIQPPQRLHSIEMPVYHEKTTTPQFQPKKYTAPQPNKNVKWEPTSESEMSEYEDGKKKSRWEQSSCSPVSLSPSLPSTSPAFNNYSGSGLKGIETPPSCPSTPGTQQNAITKRAPVFITPLRDIAVVSGQAARFECIVQSEPPPSVLWSKNGRIIENSNDHQIFFRNGVCRLTIPRAYPEDAGTYICTATNQVGAVGTTATLQVPGERRSAYI